MAEPTLEELQQQINALSRNNSSWMTSLGQTVSGIGEAGAQFAGAAIRGSTKLSDYTNSLGGITRQMGVAGDALQGSLDIVAGFIDETSGTFSGLSRSGFQLEGGLTGTAIAAGNAGMLVKEFGEYVSKNSEMLRSLGGSGNAAIAELGRMSTSFRNDSRNYSQGLRRLGFTTEDITDSLIGYAAINRTSFLQTMGNETARNRATMDFALEMDRLSQLTGKQRKELQKEMDAKRRDGRVQAFLRTETGALSDQISSSLTTIGAMDKNAATLLEDILIQGSVTRESASAAAFYGDEVLNAAHAMRAAMQAQDPAAYEAAQRQYIQAMDRAQNDTTRLNAMRIRSDSEYIRSNQAGIGQYTTINDRIATEQARLQQIENQAAQAEGREARRISRETALNGILSSGEALQNLAGVVRDAQGNIVVDPNAGDGATNAMASFTDAVTNVSSQLRTNIVDVVSQQVGPSLRTFATQLDSFSSRAVVAVGAMGAAGSGTATPGVGPGNALPPTTTGAQTPVNVASAMAAAGINQEAEVNRLPPDLVRSLRDLSGVLGGLLDNVNPQGNFLGGTALGGMLNMVGEQGPEFIMPNANSLVMNMQQMANKMRPQMEQMANQMRPQMEQMANQMRPQMEQMANQVRPQMQQMADQLSPQMDAVMQDLNRKFDRLIDAYRENTRAVNLQGRNAFRV